MKSNERLRQRVVSNLAQIPRVSRRRLARVDGEIIHGIAHVDLAQDVPRRPRRPIRKIPRVVRRFARENERRVKRDALHLALQPRHDERLIDHFLRVQHRAEIPRERVDARRGRKKTSRELDRADAVDDDAMTTDDAPALARVGRDDVLRSCATTSIGMLVVGLGARAASGAFPTRATHGDWNAALPLLGDDAGATAVAALCAAGAVTVGRIALLQVWDEFAASTDRSNAQVLGALDGAGDVAQVAVLPALEELGYTKDMILTW